MKKIVILSFLPIVLIAAMALAASKTAVYNGYLSDTLCYTNKDSIAFDGANMKTNPEKHTVVCLKNKSCAASGYGLLIKNDSGTYDFTKFDNNGNKQIKALLKSTKRTDNYYIQVKGVMAKNIIRVVKISEAQPAGN